MVFCLSVLFCLFVVVAGALCLFVCFVLFCLSLFFGGSFNFLVAVNFS